MLLSAFTCLVLVVMHGFVCLFILSLSLLLIYFPFKFSTLEAHPVFSLWMIQYLLQFGEVRKVLKLCDFAC